MEPIEISLQKSYPTVIYAPKSRESPSDLAETETGSAPPAIAIFFCDSLTTSSVSDQFYVIWMCLYRCGCVMMCYDVLLCYKL